MNKRETDYFNILSLDREESAKILEKPSMSGVKNSVVEKYSDQAHFIYELLQNADDAKATEVHFKLQKRRLIFSHDGKRHFSISNPRKEDKDKQNGTLGDINAITAIGNSSKDKESTIGKFGVGFKAVFQYTTTPHIYDKNVKFRIERFIVPKLLEEDFQGRNPEDTLFVFPFDHPDRSKEEAVTEISDKLDSLIFPILFLKNLNTISYECPDHTGRYMKELVECYDMRNVSIQRLLLTQVNSRKIIRDRMWQFSRMDSEIGEYSICIFEDENGKLKGNKYPAFCFFPTKEETNLPFLIHAPFLLTDSREGIKEGELHNKKVISKLARLFADVLLCLRDIGEQKKETFIDDDIFRVLPYNKELFSSKVKKQLPWIEFYKETLKAFQNEKLCPCNGNFYYAHQVFWSGYPSLCKAFPNKQLQALLGYRDYFWLFPKIGRQDRAKAEFISKIAYTYATEEYLFKKISQRFVERQPLEWLDTLYQYILESNHREKSIRKLPIFIDEGRNAVAAFDSNDREILFLPNEEVSGYTVIHPELMKFKSTRELVRKLNLRRPTLKDEIFNIILPQYQSGSVVDSDLNFRKIYKYYRDCPQSELDSFLKTLRKEAFLPYFTISGEHGVGKGTELYFYSKELQYYFGEKRVKYIAIQTFQSVLRISEFTHKRIRQFF